MYYGALRNIKEKHLKKLKKKKNVVGIGIGYKYVDGKKTNDLCIQFSVRAKMALQDIKKKDLIPKEVDGALTDVIQLGEIKSEQDPKLRYRPAPAGVSVGHRDITAGTLGIWVRKNDKWCILSNNHVLANSNDGNIGESILQPGPYDGGNMSDVIALLSEFVAIEWTEIPSDCPFSKLFARVVNWFMKLFGRKSRLKAIQIQAGTNLVDAALAEAIREGQDVDNRIMKIGKITSIGYGELGMKIKKYGRTTAYTEGEIIQVDASILVTYGEGKSAWFEDQLVAGNMSAGGDSGSAVISDENNLVGLLFAGSDESTIINRIQNVQDALHFNLAR